MIVGGGWTERGDELVSFSFPNLWGRNLWGRNGVQNRNYQKNKDDELIAFLLPKEQEAQREEKENPDAFPHLP